MPKFSVLNHCAEHTVFYLLTVNYSVEIKLGTNLSLGLKVSLKQERLKQDFFLILVSQ